MEAGLICLTGKLTAFSVTKRGAVEIAWTSSNKKDYPGFAKRVGYNLLQLD